MADVTQFPVTHPQRNQDGLSEHEATQAVAFAYRAGAIVERCLSDDGAVSVAEASSLEALVARL